MSGKLFFGAIVVVWRSIVETHMVLAQMFFEADQGFAEDFKQRSMLSCDVETKRPNADSFLHFFYGLAAFDFSD